METNLNDLTPQPPQPRTGVPFNPFVFVGLLAVAGLLGAFSSVNNDGIPNFWPSVQHAFEIGDGKLIAATVISALLLAWLLVAGITGSLRSRR